MNARKRPMAASPNRARQFPRAAVVGRVYIHDENQLFIAPLNNISAGGLFIEGLTEIGCGQAVKIVVKSPSLAEPIQAQGAVVRVETATRRGLAVQFSHISKEAQMAISRCVEYATARPALVAKVA